LSVTPVSSPSDLLGRDRSLDRLRALVDGVREGRGAAIRIEGAPGVGKSALLEAIVPADLTCLRATGVESEAGLALAGLEELLAPLDAAGLVAGDDAHDPAGLLREVSARLAAAAPLLVLVDDLQWLDSSSRAAVGFLARRAARLGIGVVAVWSLRGETPEDWPGVETLALDELAREDALALARRGGLTEGAAEALVAAVGGNALALVEAPAELSAAQRGGRAPLPDPPPAGERLRRAFEDRVAGLPEATREALLFAAAGAPAASVAADLGPAEDEGLVRLGAALDGAAGMRGAVVFTHPLVRAAAYHSAPPSARRAAHERIAAAAAEPERSWQLALGAAGPDEELAARLEALAGEALRQGAPGTAAAILERAVALTPEPAAALPRALTAATAAATAGQPARARGVLDAVLPTVADPGAHADVQLLRGMAIHQSGRPREAHALLEAEAEAIAATDPMRAAALLTHACIALMGTGPLSGMAATAERARALAGPGADLIPSVIEAEVLVSLGEHGRARGLLAAHEPALAGWDPTAPGHEVLAVAALCRLWLGDHAEAEAQLTRLVEANRAAGAVTPLALPLAVLATVHLRRGDLALAAACAEEAAEIAETGLGTGFVGTLALAAVAMIAAHRGDAEACEAVAGRMLSLGGGLELPSTLACAEQALGHLALGEGDAELAVGHFRRALDHTHEHGTIDPAFLFTHADLVEALVRVDRPEEAAPVLAELEAGAELTGGAWAGAAVHRCRALVGPPEEVDAHLEAALAGHADPAMPFEAARTRLAVGERLRRARRRADARVPLAAAHEAFYAMGARGWAARSASELVAAGGSAPGDGAPGGDWAADLTGRERDVCELVAAGRTNREVGAALFLSPRTVEHHLRSSYRKLGIRSRTELAARVAGR
jgi:DNA-binding CsgD family transcriptional regulator/tetratricopeptide (TPR) repeat protein